MKNIYFIVLLVLSTSKLFAQDFNLQWSDRMRYDNSKEGFFSGFIGSNDTYVYSLFNNLSLKRQSKNKRLDIVAYNKNSMNEVAKCSLRDKSDPERNDMLKDAEYFKTIILEDVVYVFWTKAEKSSAIVYAEVLDADLNELIKLQEVRRFNYPEIKKKKQARAPIVILSGKAWNNDVLIGTEIFSGEDEAVEFEYMIFDSELKELTKSTVELPFVQKGKKWSGGISSSYEYGSDGNLYIKSFLSMSKEETESLAKGELSSYSVLSIVDIASGELTANTIRFENKNVFKFDYEVNEKGVRLFGFYNDLTIDPKGLSTNGIFYATIDAETNEMTEPIFSLFDKETLDELFKNDREDKKRTYALSKKKRKANEAIDEVSLDNRFEIESVEIRADGGLILFCSKMYNYSVTTCTTNSNGGQTCTTRYYCSKSNVTAFSLSPEGELLWSTNIDRQKTYSGWDVYDLKVITKDESAYVIYGSSYDVDAEKKTRKTRKSKSEARDNFEYAIFDMETGGVEKREYIVNTPETEKKERKYVTPLSIKVLDNEYYIDSKKLGYKPGLTAAGCVASVACFPIIYFVVLSPKFRKGDGHIGRLDLID